MLLAKADPGLVPLALSPCSAMLVPGGTHSGGEQTVAGIASALLELLHWRRLGTELGLPRNSGSWEWADHLV